MQRCKSLHPKSFFVEADKANTLFRKRSDACYVLSYRVAVYAEHLAYGSVVVVEVLQQHDKLFSGSDIAVAAFNLRHCLRKLYLAVSHAQLVVLLGPRHGCAAVLDM